MPGTFWWVPLLAGGLPPMSFKVGLLILNCGWNLTPARWQGHLYTTGHLPLSSITLSKDNIRLKGASGQHGRLRVNRALPWEVCQSRKEGAYFMSIHTSPPSFLASITLTSFQFASGFLGITESKLQYGPSWCAMFLGLILSNNITAEKADFDL